MDNKKASIVVVLGMHRSGSSAITRGLQVMGVALGDQLVGPMPVNPKGFWEDIDINALDVDMLRELHMTWHSLTPIGPAEVEALRDRGYLSRAKDLLRKKIGDLRLFGFKDPRVSKLLPFWNEVFQDCDLNVHYILTLRHPRSVADSLAQRDGFDAAKSHLLWLGHMLSNLAGTAGKNRIVVDYDRLMQCPERELARIAGKIDARVDPAELQLYKTEFLDTRLRHSTYAPDALEQDQSCPPPVREIYPVLLDIASDKGSMDDASFDFELVAWVKEFERTRSHLALADRLQAQTSSIKEMIAAQDGHVAKLKAGLSGRDREIARLERVVDDQYGQIVKTKAELAELERLLAERDARVQALLDSTSWRITAPLRSLRSLFGTVRPAPRFLHFARGIYLHLPFSDSARTHLKSIFFHLGAPVLRHTELYRNWASFPASARHPAAVQSAPAVPPSPNTSHTARLGSSLFDQVAGKSGISLEYVPLAADSLAGRNLDLRLIAFYLPQFHPIPENDEWWGKGFTEWTNVSKAQPQFEGHYQPHLPGELGFYDLRLIEVMRRQVELARQYGLGGFCFHYYWFDGRKLLERPIAQYLAHPELDLPFCICWANENWTRRWDGSDDEVLMTQRHTPESDTAFIREVASMFADARYMRVDGKPVLIVYRASLLPDARGTVQRWREYCREQGFGEIYVVVVQSFDVSDPRLYGADAAVEFPPHRVNIGEIRHQLAMQNTHFEGKVFDYGALAASFCSKPATDYVLHRAVVPGWDNEARKPGRGHCFHHSTPARYADWLSQVCSETVARYPKDQRLVFVNAWNEWAEGAHLEPDRRYGYAYLHATANVLREHACDDAETAAAFVETQTRFSKRSDIAIVAHLYYMEWLDELATTLAESTLDPDVFVSVRADVLPHELAAIRAALPKAYLIRAATRGRDWQPFIQLLPVVQNFGYVAACKIHSKKSLHLRDGELVRSQLLKALMSPDAIAQIVLRFRNDPRLGMVAPAGTKINLAERDRHVLNTHWLERLLSELGAESQIREYRFDFVAGSMFWFRPAALTLLSGLMLNAHDFERELGQVDGTLAHALERLALLTIEHAGYTSETFAVPISRQTEPA